jgi:hypothetical protein
VAGKNTLVDFFPVHEIGRIDGGKVFQNIGNMFGSGRNMFYNRKNEFLIKIPAGKRSGIRIITEFCGIPSGSPNQDQNPTRLNISLLGR